MVDNPRIEQLRRRIQTDPASIAFAALAEEYRRAGHYHEAIDVCRTGLVRHPAYLSARVTLGRALIELDRLDEAETELSDVLRAAPENLAAIRALSEIHTRRRRAPAPTPGATGEPTRAFEEGFLSDLQRVGVPDAPAQPAPTAAALAAVARLERFLDAILALKAQRAGAGA
jgi:tetratricopeptide (TPR) repeat protein